VVAKVAMVKMAKVPMVVVMMVAVVVMVAVMAVVMVAVAVMMLAPHDPCRGSNSERNCQDRQRDENPSHGPTPLSRVSPALAQREKLNCQRYYQESRSFWQAQRRFRRPGHARPRAAQTKQQDMTACFFEPDKFNRIRMR
jgi:hypothetical protein